MEGIPEVIVIVESNSNRERPVPAMTITISIILFVRYSDIHPDTKKQRAAAGQPVVVLLTG
jgi:hypothetical protein